MNCSTFKYSILIVFNVYLRPGGLPLCCIFISSFMCVTVDASYTRQYIKIKSKSRQSKYRHRIPDLDSRDLEVEPQIELQMETSIKLENYGKVKCK
uniref:Uncharacterized protein n=2 Tax=Anguilla anguilla TaxID=7936 RepID=A0A0E9V9V4_ANGAN